MKGQKIFLILLSISILALGCNTTEKKTRRDGVMSEELPISVGDIAEIRDGEQNHIRIMEEYEPYESPKLETYLNAITGSIAEVSSRPHLPYHVVLLDADEVNVFGGPGGYIYMTRGFLNFVASESEIAGVIAHEIAHISGLQYSTLPPEISKGKRFYDLLLKGSDMASNSIGTYGTAGKYGLKAIQKAGPFYEKHVKHRFTIDQEVAADANTVDFLVKAGYDPRGYLELNERLARVDMQEVTKFINFMNTHPPFVNRRNILKEKVGGIDFEKGDIEFKKDMLSEVRQITVNQPAPSSAVLFEPALGSHLGSPVEMNETASRKNDEMITVKKRWAWY